MERSRKIAKEAGIYTFSSQLTQFITVIAAFLSRRFLGPLQMGIWATIQLVIEYSSYSSFGIMNAIFREIPYYLGKKREDIAEAIKNLTFTTVLFGAGIVAFGVLVYAFFMKGKIRPELTYGLIFLSVIVVLQRLNDFLIQLLRCYQKLMVAGKQMIYSSIVNALLVGLLSYYFKIYGFLWAVGLSLVFNIVYILRNVDFHLRLKFDFERFKSLVALGLPLMLIGILNNVLRSIDRIVIVKGYGFEALGFYTIAVMVGGYVGNFVSAFAIVYIPHLEEKIGVRDQPGDLKEFLFKSSSVFTFVMPVIIGFSWVVMPYFIELLLPEYIPGITAMKIFSIGVFFQALYQTYHDFLIAIRKQLFLFPILLVSSGVAMGLNFGALYLKLGISGIAFATTLTSLISFSSIYFFASRYLISPPERIKRYFIYLANGAYFTAVLLLLDRFLPGHDLPLIFWKSLLLGIFYSPFFYMFERKFHLIPMLKKKFLSYL